MIWSNKNFKFLNNDFYISDLKMGKMSLDNVEQYSGEINEEPSVEDMQKELTNCIYLQDSSVEIYGLKIYGTPWQPEFCGWAFNLPRGQVSTFLFENQIGAQIEITAVSFLDQSVFI